MFALGDYAPRRDSGDTVTSLKPRRLFSDSPDDVLTVNLTVLVVFVAGILLGWMLNTLLATDGRYTPWNLGAYCSQARDDDPRCTQ